MSFGNTRAENFEDSIKTARNTERLSDARRTVEDFRCSLEKIELVMNAMWDIMQEHGVTADELNGRIKTLVESGNGPKNHYQSEMMPCPKCGKTIQESSIKPMTGRCVFCGENVFFYPFVKSDDN